jgi:hypothetical protein
MEIKRIFFVMAVCAQFFKRLGGKHKFPSKPVLVQAIV